MDNVMEQVKPLYWDAVLDSPIPLKVLATPTCSMLSDAV